MPDTTRGFTEAGGWKDDLTQNAAQHQCIERDEAELAHLIEDPRRPLRHQPGQHVAAIQRRNRNQVEERQQQVGLDGHAENRREAIRVELFKQRPVHDGDDHGLQEITDRPGRRHDHEIPAMVPEPADVHRHRLRPADDRQPADHRDERQQESSDRIDVDHRVQRHPPQHSGGRIAELIGGPCVRSLVNRERHDYDCESDQASSEVQGCPQKESRKRQG
jgi:hypothetical protein